MQFEENPANLTEFLSFLNEPYIHSRVSVQVVESHFATLCCTVLDRYLLATISCYIRNKTILFVKIESWNFQNLRDFLISWNLTKFHLPYSREQKHVSVSNMGCQEIKVVRFLRCSGYLTNTSCVCQVAVISKRSNDKQKSFVPNAIFLCNLQFVASN